MAVLTELPSEILQHILGYVDPPDLAQIPRVCNTFHHFVKGNTSLFRLVYLNNFDTPPDKSNVDWERMLKDVVRLYVIGRSSKRTIQDKKKELPFVHDTVKSFLRHAATAADSKRVDHLKSYQTSLNAGLLSLIFKDKANQAAFLCQSRIYERAREVCAGEGFHNSPQPEHQMSAHLHCLYGVPILRIHPDAYPTRRGSMGLYACSKVYDLREYTENTKWGPFMDDDTGRVDWEKVEAIMVLIGNNLKKSPYIHTAECKNPWGTPFAGTWPHSYVKNYMSNELGPLELEDPYGITGSWLRIVCFMDYADFFTFNFTSGADGLPRSTPLPAIDYGQATRLILMDIYVTKIEPPGPEDGQELPVVHFEGNSEPLDDMGGDDANSSLKGTVRLTREGEVRWTTFSVFNGSERWRSESVQVGGVNSAKGVFGNWFDKDFSPRGPAGPTAFWKVLDGVTMDPYSDGLRHSFSEIIREYQLMDDDEVDDDDDEDMPGLELEITGVAGTTWAVWTDD